MIKKLQLFLVFLVPFSFTVFSQEGIPQRPNPPRLVNDFAEVLSPAEEQELESKLVAFDDSTGTQVVIITINDLGGYDKAEFTYTLGEKWGVGQKGFDNGVVIMVKPTGGQGQRHTFIAPGYGLEGVIPDATANRIVENEMIPEFKNANYYQGLHKATDIIMALANKDFAAADYNKKQQSPPKFLAFIPLLIIIFFFVLITFAKKRHQNIGHNTSLWTLLFLMSSAGRSHSGSYGNFQSGSGSFRGSGGGGFGGFGGDSFGGGGAGGSW